jgi:hypothetical protein
MKISMEGLIEGSGAAAGAGAAAGFGWAMAVTAASDNAAANRIARTDILPRGASADGRLHWESVRGSWAAASLLKGTTKYTKYTKYTKGPEALR